MNKKKSFFTVKEIVEIALLLALAVVLDISGIKIGHAAFNMVPLLIIAYRHGPLKCGLITGVAYALINVAFDAWEVNPVFLIFDYILGYGSIALAGFFAKKVFDSQTKHWKNILWLSLSILVCSAIRISCSSISGIIVYNLTLIESFWANLTIYVGWDCLLALIALIILYPSIILLNKRFPTNFSKKLNKENE